MSKRLQMEKLIHHPQGNLLALKQSVKMDLQLRQSERKGEQSRSKLKEKERREESGRKNNTICISLLCCSGCDVVQCSFTEPLMPLMQYAKVILHKTAFSTLHNRTAGEKEGTNPPSPHLLSSPSKSLSTNFPGFTGAHQRKTLIHALDECILQKLVAGKFRHFHDVNNAVRERGRQIAE